VLIDLGEYGRDALAGEARSAVVQARRRVSRSEGKGGLVENGTGIDACREGVKGQPGLGVSGENGCSTGYGASMTWQEGPVGVDTSQERYVQPLLSEDGAKVPTHEQVGPQCGEGPDVAELEDGQAQVSGTALKGISDSEPPAPLNQQADQCVW
jgi:hypothetical protein